MKYNDLKQIFYKFKEVKNKGITFVDSHSSEKYLSYNEIYINVLKMAKHLKENNVKINNKVIFQIDSVEKFVYCFWACIISEFYVVPLEPVKNKESRNKFVSVSKDLNNTFIITTESQYKNLSECCNEINSNVLIIDKFIEIQLEESDFKETYESLNNKVAFIQFSSGSTGNPKGVMLTHKNLISNINAIYNGIMLNDKDIGLSWLPLTHDMGLIGFHLTPACKLINHVIISTRSFVFDPTLWLRLIEKYKATIICSPNFGYTFLLKYINKKKSADCYDLSSVRVIFNGAEPISYHVVNLFLNEMRKFKLKGNTMFPVYGLAEGTLAVAFPNVNEEIRYIKVNKSDLTIGSKIISDDNGLKIVCEGREVSGVNVKIRTHSMKEAENDVVGKIYISGDNVSEKYLINDVAVKALNDMGEIFTGDIGFKHKDDIYVIGRESELIVNGKNYFCSDAEEYIDNKMKLKYKFVLLPVRFEEECKIIVFVRHKYSEDIVKCFSQIKDEVFAETSIMLSGIVFVDYIPKTTSGKIKRFELLKEFYEGNYGDIVKVYNENVDVNNYSELEKNILNLFEKVYGEKPDIMKDVSDLFNESIKNISFLVSIEEFYNIKLNFDDFIDVTTVKEICTRVCNYIL